MKNCSASCRAIWNVGEMAAVEFWDDVLIGNSLSLCGTTECESVVDTTFSTSSDSGAFGYLFQAQ